MEEFESLIGYMKRPHFTNLQQIVFERIYQEHIREGITLYTYIGEEPQCVKDEREKWYNKVRETFGEDSEITRYLTQPRKEFFT